LHGYGFSLNVISLVILPKILKLKLNDSYITVLVLKYNSSSEFEEAL